MKKIKFALLLLVVIFCACKKNKTNPDSPQTHEIDASVTQFSCTDFYYYRVNLSTASSTEVDFGDGSPSLVLSSNVGYHQYTNIGNFNLKFKQTFSDGQVVEKTFSINIPQLCKFKRVLSTNIPRSDFGSSNDIASFEFGGNVYFDYYINGYRNVYNIASNRFFKTGNFGNGVSNIFDGTYLYHIIGGGSTFQSITKHTFDSIPSGGSVTSIPVGIPKRYRNLEIVANGKLYYGFGTISGAINDAKLYAVDCTTGANTIITTPYPTNAGITVGGQAFYNNKIYIFADVSTAAVGLSGHKVIIFDPFTNTFTSLAASIPAFMVGPGSSNKTKVINNYAFMRNANTEEVIVFDFNSNTFLSNCELKKMKGINFVANNKFYSLNLVYDLNPYVFPNSELWEYQP